MLTCNLSQNIFKLENWLDSNDETSVSAKTKKKPQSLDQSSEESVTTPAPKAGKGKETPRAKKQSIPTTEDVDDDDDDGFTYVKNF